MKAVGRLREKRYFSKPVRLGVIGGSGLYEMEGCRLLRELSVKTPFGPPSDRIAIVDVGGEPVAFLPRHGRGHRISPSEINVRANIFALKSLGVEQLISVGAVGSLKEELAPTHLILPDQLVDKTRCRVQTFFRGGIVAHVQFDQPYCPHLRSLLAESARESALDVHEDGIYVCMEGPAFSTKAESLEHRRLGYSVVGMTALPEAKLAREAVLCAANVSFVTDYDCWKEGEEAVTAERVISNLKEGVSRAQKLLRAALPILAARGRSGVCRCPHALAGAIVTDPRLINRAAARKLGLLIAKAINI
ncbi:MAG: S-methyl-5'-thioadenosine phosphorylase [Elusimicrobiota bacterium]